MLSYEYYELSYKAGLIDYFETEIVLGSTEQELGLYTRGLLINFLL